MKDKIALYWSGGVSSLLALKKLKESFPGAEIILISFFDSSTNELGHTGIPEEIISLQAKMLNLKLIRLYQGALSKKLILKLQDQGFKLYSGDQNSNFSPFEIEAIGLNKGINFKDDISRSILTSINSKDHQYLLGKELQMIEEDLSDFKTDTLVTYDPLFRVRLAFSKNIIVEKDGHFICKIRSS